MQRLCLSSRGGPDGPEKGAKCLVGLPPWLPGPSPGEAKAAQPARGKASKPVSAARATTTTRKEKKKKENQQQTFQIELHVPQAPAGSDDKCHSFPSS